MANARLRAAEKAKFGHATTAPSSVASGPAAGGLDIEDLEELETFTEKVEGDRAVVSSPMDPKLAMEFVRVGGIWKLPVSSLVGKLDPASGAAIRSATKAQVGIIDAIAADVAAGKLTTEEQVRHELSRRFAERLAEATKASATQAAPTTSPATSPVLGPKT